MDIKQFVRIKLESQKEEDIYLANTLSSLLNLPAPAADIDLVPFYFSYRNSRLELFENSTGKLAPKGICVDFLDGPAFYRYTHDRTIKQALAKAAGIRQGTRPTICDLTAGFGNDGFVLASLGCQVTMVERSPIAWALLYDGIRRGLSDPDIGKILAGRTSLHLAESVDFLSSNNKRFETIYLDPMYPHRKQNALNKREMRLLRKIVGDDPDSEKLLETARRHALKRVVVKRPGGAAAINKTAPSYIVKSKNSRYDIYLNNYL